MPWLLFRPKSFLEPELELWHVSAWKWLIGNLGGLSGIAQKTLVVPTGTYFPRTDAGGHDRVLHVFLCIKQLFGLGHEECRLVRQEPTPDLRVGEVIALKREEAVAAGTFNLTSGYATISYDPDLEKDAFKLVAVLAHELAHLLLKSFDGELPVGEQASERITDLATVAMGFGVFGSNCAFGFEQYQDAFSQGWRSSRLGYLDQREWAFALAIWINLVGIEARSVRPYLKSHIYTDLQSALRSLKRRPELLSSLHEARPVARSLSTVA